MALLEGLEASEVMFSQLEAVETLRMDSEYFQKDYLKIEQFIKANITRFSKIADFGIAVDGSAFYPALEPHYDTGTFPFLRVGDVKRYVDFDNCIKIPREVLPGYPTLKSVRPGDIVLTKGGTVAKAGYIEQESCVSRDLIFLNSSDLPEEESISLYLYLATDFAYKQLVRSASQSVQPHLTITLVRNLDVFALNDTFKRLVVEQYKQARNLMVEAKALYRQAEADLLHHLGLPAQPPRSAVHEVITNIKTLAQSAVSSGRWDAEFYETRHDSLAAQLMAGPWLRLGRACRAAINRGVQPEFVEGGDVFVVASKAVRPYGLDLRPDETTSAEFFNSTKAAKGRIEQYDVLLNGTGRGTLGRAGIHTSATPALADNHVTILRLHPGGLNPFYLMLFLNSWPGQLQSEQWQCGSSGQTELYPNQMEQFIIPDLPPAQQAAIAEQVQRSFGLRTESEALLSRAKQAVEVAIEQGEAAGLAWLAAAS